MVLICDPCMWPTNPYSRQNYVTRVSANYIDLGTSVLEFAERFSIANYPTLWRRVLASQEGVIDENQVLIEKHQLISVLLCTLSIHCTHNCRRSVTGRRLQPPLVGQKSIKIRQIV